MANIESWAVDLAEVGAVYPFQGTEKIMVIAAVVAWLVWHMWQLGAEQRKMRDDINKYGNKETLDQAIDDD